MPATQPDDVSHRLGPGPLAGSRVLGRCGGREIHPSSMPQKRALTTNVSSALDMWFEQVHPEFREHRSLNLVFTKKDKFPARKRATPCTSTPEQAPSDGLSPSNSRTVE